MKIRPLRDRIVVKRIEKSEEKVGGIILPDTTREKSMRAEVIAAGSGRVLKNGKKLPVTELPEKNERTASMPAVMDY